MIIDFITTPLFIIVKSSIIIEKKNVLQLSVLLNRVKKQKKNTSFHINDEEKEGINF